MKRVTLLLIASISIACNGSPMIQSTFELDASDVARATDPMYRLVPQNITISRYEIALTPYFSGPRMFTFDGEVKITAKASAAVNQIKLHARNLKIDSITMGKVGETPEQINKINPIDTTYDFWTIEFPAALAIDDEVIINIMYAGELNNDMYGFYRSSYEEIEEVDGVQNIMTKWMATTQFQPVHARRAFPCFDEPGYKAVFQITVKRPTEFSETLSNTKIKSSTPDPITGLTADEFHDTPRMSAYLIAFIVSEYTAANQTEPTEEDQYGIWARPAASDQGEYAFLTSKKIVDTLGAYLDYPFGTMSPNLKNDHVSIPDFSAGAMENWGLATYREGYLMYDPKETNVRYQQQIAAILSHEIAHFWFGDLVTCKWWSETWLNEGFARYFQYFLTDWMEYENMTMDMTTQFNVAQIHTAMSVDAPDSAPPMTNINTNSPAEVQAQFGSVTYNKGAAVIRMVKDWINEETFKKALATYMKEMKEGVVEEDDLFERLQGAANTDNTIAEYTNSNVAMFMKSWTNFNGFPILNVTVTRDGDNSKVDIKQTRFLKMGQNYTGEDRLWHIPITYTTQSEKNFMNVKPKFILIEAAKEVEEKIKAEDWIIFNIQQSGYYRVMYDDNSLKLITDALLKNTSDIHTFNQAQLVDDLFNFARENYMSYAQMLRSTLFLKESIDYEPWSAAFAGFAFLRIRYSNLHDVHHRLDNHILKMMENKLIANLGFEEKDGDNHLTKLFRMNTFNLACQLGHGECKTKSMQLFAEMSSKPINPNLREYVYCNALRHGSGAEFDTLWDKYLFENVVNEKIVIMGALGCSRQNDKLRRLLDITLFQNSAIRDQDKMNAFNSVLNGNPENVEVAFSFVKDNVNTIKQAFGQGNLRTMIDGIANRMSETQLGQLKTFLESNRLLTEAEKTAGMRSIENSETAMKWAESNSQQFKDFFKEVYGSAAALKVSFVLMAVTLMAVFMNN